ncbi:MAG: hypothetical protein LBG92_07075 [Prevotellaceae bacterium]|jgi:hypothetical protein|nr:hypothetical protein [Prevotellaceae bacterium]
MKKYINILFIVILTVNGCKNTNENLVERGATIVAPIMSEPSPAYFSDNIDESYVAFDLSLPKGETVDKASIEIVYKNKSVILKDITIPVTNLKITAGDVIRALGISTYELGDVFYLSVLTLKNGRTTRSAATSFSIPVVCYFDPSMLVGSFDFESEDWGVSGNVTMEADPDDPYKIYINGYPQAEGLTGNGNRIELNINPNSFKIQGPKVVLADDLSEWGFPYRNYSYEPLSGSYSACDGKYTVTFAINVLEGDFGRNAFVFTKIDN